MEGAIILQLEVRSDQGCPSPTQGELSHQGTRQGRAGPGKRRLGGGCSRPPRGLCGKASAVLKAAEEGGRLHLSLGAIRELRGIVELLARIIGELDEQPVHQTLNLFTSPEYLEFRTTALKALEPFPEARVALAERSHGI